MKDTSWDHALEVTADGNGLVGHGGGILLRKLADQCGLTAELDAALARKGTSPQFSRGVTLASTAIAIAMGATAMTDIEVLDQLALVLGAAPGDSTVRRTLHLADDRALTRVARRARARIRKHVWSLIAVADGFPWLEIAGKTLAGWPVLDMDGTLITAYSDKEGAAPTWKKGFGFHPLGCWIANTRECPDMLLRPGNAGSNTFDDHKEVLDSALKQVPAPFRRKVIVRIDGAGASHDLVKHLLTLSSPRKMLLFTCGWMITASDEAAITAVPEDAWKPGVRQDGTAEDDKDVAEITHLMSRAGKWPGGLRWIARRVKPSRRHLKNLTAYERQTGWKYSITCTNIRTTGSAGCRAATTRSTSTCCTATMPPSRPPVSAPRKRWGCGTCRPKPGRSTGAGSSPRTSPLTSPPGRASSASTTKATFGTPIRTRSATGSGTSLAASPVTPARRSSRSARTGPGRTRSTCWQRLCDMPAPT
jgi:Transposase DDE domain group 1